MCYYRAEGTVVHRRNGGRPVVSRANRPHPYRTASLHLISLVALLAGITGCGGGDGGGGVNIRRTGDVRGRVLHAGTLAPVSGATIQVNGENVATTNGLGEFEAYDVQAGDVQFRITAPGYEALTESRDLSANQMNDMRSVPFFLAPTLLAGHGSVSGRVVDGSSTAVSGATVDVTTTATAVGITRNDGNFVVYNIPAGIGNLTVTGTPSQPGNAYLYGLSVPSGSNLPVGTLTLGFTPPPPPFPP